MPELPEVEFTRRQLTRWAQGQHLNRLTLGPHVLVSDQEHLVGISDLVGQPLSAIERCGKYLFLKFGDQWVCSHLAMTGKWLPMKMVGDRARFVRFILHMDTVVLAFLDTRKLGKLERIELPDWRSWLALKKVGMDVFDSQLTGSCLHSRLSRTRRLIKTVLLDQKVLAGVGNIYACEALFLAKISPIERACDLSLDSVQRLLAAVREVMIASLAREAGEEIYYLTEGNPTNPFLVYGRAGKPCEACGTAIVRMVQQARSTFFCDLCQSASQPESP